jgi:hypothetical protein
MILRHEGIHMKFWRRMFHICIHSWVNEFMQIPLQCTRHRDEDTHCVKIHTRKKGTHHGSPSWWTSGS